MGVAISPNGRFAVVANAQENPAAAIGVPESSPRVVSGYSLAVVDTRTMRVASVYTDPSLTLYAGIAAVADPQNPGQTLVLAADGTHGDVRVFSLASDGSLSPSARIHVGGYPASIAVAPNGRIAYVTSELGDRVSAIDLNARALAGSAPTGYFPFGVGVAGDRVYVANGGLSNYHVLPHPRSTPAFAAPAVDAYRSSSFSIVALDAQGTIEAQQPQTPNVRLDPIPDGTQLIGGARPDAVAVRHGGKYAYVTLANVDRVVTVALDGDPHVVTGLDLRLFVNAPYGTQPGAAVLSRDAKRLYVALAGLNSVAVLDAHNPVQLHRLGLIPTGADPSALALSPDGRYLYVTSAQGVDGWGELQRVDLHKLPLERATLSALRYSRSVAVARPNPVVPPLRSGVRSSAIDHVVCILVGDDSYDELFGDLGRGNGDAAYVSDGAAVTPNLHALANAYALADNFYLEHRTHDLNEATALGGEPTLYTRRVTAVTTGRAPLDDRGADPEDYPRVGYLFNALARAGLSYRDYGGMLQLSGYRAEPGRGTSGPGAIYDTDVPAVAALDGLVDLAYPGWNPAVSDASRAAEFVRDMGGLVRTDQEPAFAYVWLPDVRGMAGPDRALGRIVAFLSGTPHWSSTAVFIVSDAISAPRDHVNQARGFALVVSPLARQQFVGSSHLSMASVVKTEEELLGLPPLSLADLLAGDMAEFFGQVPYPSAYQATP